MYNLLEVANDLSRYDFFRKTNRDMRYSDSIKIVADMEKNSTGKLGKCRKSVLILAGHLSNLDMSIITSKGDILSLNALRKRIVVREAEIDFITRKVDEQLPDFLSEYAKWTRDAVSHLLTGSEAVSERDFNTAVLCSADHFLVNPLEGLSMLIGCGLACSAKSVDELSWKFVFDLPDLLKIAKEHHAVFQVCGDLRVVKLW